MASFDVLRFWPTEPIEHGDTFVLSYPSGRSAANYDADAEHQLVVYQTELQAPDDFTVGFGVGHIEITWLRASIINPGVMVMLELYRPAPAGGGGVGPTGPQGPAGPTGPQGPAGPAGSGAGVDMVSEYDVDVTGATAADDAVLAAVAAGYRSLFFQRGSYRFNSELAFSALGLSFVGEDRWNTVFDVRGNRWATFGRGTPAGGSTPDVTRCRVANIHFKLSSSSGGLLVQGHQPVFERLNFSGGQAGKWCMELANCNEAFLSDIAGGQGGGDWDLSANGLYIYGTDDDFGADQPYRVNYGDAMVQQVYFKIKLANQIGFKTDHLGRVYNSGNSRAVINNVLFSRCHVNSPGTKPSGSIGFHLRRTMRCELAQCDVEQLDIGYKLEGDPVNGSAGAAGACRYIWFLGSTALGNNTGYVDSNGTVAGSVMECSFLGPQGFNRLPAGVSADSINQAGEGDWFLSGGMWLPAPNDHSPAVNLRAANPTSGFGAQQLVITTDYNNGTTRDGHPKTRYPRKGLLLDISGSAMAAVRRTIGVSVDSNARIEIGNGAGHAQGRLRGIDLQDLVFQTPYTTEPVSPYMGGFFYCQDRNTLPSTVEWAGPGWYMRVEDKVDGGSSALNWTPVLTRRGLTRMRRVTASQSLSRSDFDAFLTVENAGNITLTLDGNLLREDEGGAFGADYFLDPTTGKQSRVGARIWVLRKGNGRVLFAAGAGTQITGQGGITEIPSVGGLACIALRRKAAYDGTTTSLEADITYFGARPPGALRGRQVKTSSFTLAQGEVGNVIRCATGGAMNVTIAATDGNGDPLLPDGLTAAEVMFVRQSTGSVSLVAGTGVTINTSALSIAAQNDVVRCIIERATGTATDYDVWLQGPLA